MFFVNSDPLIPNLWIFLQKNIFSISFWQLKTLDDKIIVKYCKFNFLAIYIFVQRIFLNNVVFFKKMYLHFKVFFILERPQVVFFVLKTLKIWKKNEKWSDFNFFADSDFWRSNWPLPIVKLNEFNQSKITKTSKTCYAFRILTEKFFVSDFRFYKCSM